MMIIRVSVGSRNMSSLIDVIFLQALRILQLILSVE